jgi:CO dehydrogenase/acetyl-CoA synthase alpha subunit
MKNLLLLIVTVIFVGSCASVKIIKEETAPGADISAYKTYNYYAFHAAGDTTPRKTDQRMSQIRKAITNELNQKGYAFSANNPDFLVNISMNVKQDVQTREKTPITDPQVHVGQPNYTYKPDDQVVGYYKTGTMEIHIVDAKKNILVWQNISEGVLADKERDIDQRMQERFKKVFEHFPASKK